LSAEQVAPKELGTVHFGAVTDTSGSCCELS
jgi:hypothetical protein